MHSTFVNCCLWHGSVSAQSVAPMIRFHLLGFPIVIHWFFWVNCALLGGANAAAVAQDILTRPLKAEGPGN